MLFLVLLKNFETLCRLNGFNLELQIVIINLLRAFFKGIKTN